MVECGFCGGCGGLRGHFGEAEIENLCFADVVDGEASQRRSIVARPEHERLIGAVTVNGQVPIC